MWVWTCPWAHPDAGSVSEAVGFLAVCLWPAPCPNPSFPRGSVSEVSEPRVGFRLCIWGEQKGGPFPCLPSSYQQFKSLWIFKVVIQGQHPVSIPSFEHKHIDCSGKRNRHLPMLVLCHEKAVLIVFRAEIPLLSSPSSCRKVLKWSQYCSATKVAEHLQSLEDVAEKRERGPGGFPESSPPLTSSLMTSTSGSDGVSQGHFPTL